MSHRKPSFLLTDSFDCDSTQSSVVVEQLKAVEEPGGHTVGYEECRVLLCAGCNAIPFSKFFLSCRGRTLDEQYSMWLDKMNTVGFTLADGADGPFQLEIDFIGVCNDRALNNDFPYEPIEGLN